MAEYLNKQKIISMLKDLVSYNAEFGFIKDYDELPTAIRMLENMPSEKFDSNTVTHSPLKPVKDYIDTGDIDVLVKGYHCPRCNFIDGCDLEDTFGNKYNFCPHCGQPFDWDDIEEQTNKNLNWYMFSQNNSYGRFEVDDKVCHRLYIEAETFDEAVEKAEELGCYWDGVEKGIDCPCCGDRWDKCNKHPIDLKKYDTEGMAAEVSDGIYPDTIAEWNKRYGDYEIIEQPRFIDTYGKIYTGKIRIHDIEEYAKYLADTYGYTSPDARIYYSDGTVKEIFKNMSVG